LQVLLDSVILIDHLNGIRAATEYLAKVHLHSAISVITRAVVLPGYDPHQLPTIQRFLEAFPTLPIDQPVADLCATLRREHKWKTPDAFQAALARIHKLKLATRNTKCFPPDRHEFVVVPYSFSPSSAV
jgi:predicted nucleic acid-binding protein